MSEREMVLAEGMRVWWEPSLLVNGNAIGSETTVVKVGRVWAQLANHHCVDVRTLDADGSGYASPGRIWPDEATAKAHRALRVAWQDFCSDVRYARLPEKMTVARINEIRLELGLQVTEPSHDPS